MLGCLRIGETTSLLLLLFLIEGAGLVWEPHGCCRCDGDGDDDEVDVCVAALGATTALVIVGRPFFSSRNVVVTDDRGVAGGEHCGNRCIEDMSLALLLLLLFLLAFSKALPWQGQKQHKYP